MSGLDKHFTTEYSRELTLIQMKKRSSSHTNISAGARLGVGSTGAGTTRIKHTNIGLKNSPASRHSPPASKQNIKQSASKPTLVRTPTQPVVNPLPKTSTPKNPPSDTSMKCPNSLSPHNDPYSCSTHHPYERQSPPNKLYDETYNIILANFTYIF